MRYAYLRGRTHVMSTQSFKDCPLCVNAVIALSRLFPADNRFTNVITWLLAQAAVIISTTMSALSNAQSPN